MQSACQVVERAQFQRTHRVFGAAIGGNHGNRNVEIVRGYARPPAALRHPAAVRRSDTDRALTRQFSSAVLTLAAAVTSSPCAATSAPAARGYRLHRRPPVPCAVRLPVRLLIPIPLPLTLKTVFCLLSTYRALHGWRRRFHARYTARAAAIAVIGGEERFEQPVAIGRRDATAVVADFDNHTQFVAPGANGNAAQPLAAIAPRRCGTDSTSLDAGGPDRN